MTNDASVCLTGSNTFEVGIRSVADGGSVLPLYCPGPVRNDVALGEQVNRSLLDWAERIGIYPGRLDRLHTANIGRFVMLTHPDCDDPDRLLIAAKCATAEWATDDYYCDDEAMGARADLVGPRLAMAAAAIDPAHLPRGYVPPLNRAMREDPVLVTLRSAIDHVERYASSPQLGRLRHELAAMFVAYGAEAGWRLRGRTPPVWEYLTSRQANSFMPCLALIDVVGGYELAAEVYAKPHVRRALTQAATAACLVNDLYSMSIESSASGQDFNLPTLLAAEERCSLGEAVDRSIELHDELVRGFESEAAALAGEASPALRRYLNGVWAWLGGSHEWHATSERYQTAA